MAKTMNDVRNKLAKARELCPGMHEDMYLLTDYMSKNANDELFPEGMLIFTVCVHSDLENGRNGFGGEFPEELKARKDTVFNEFYLIPQVIDEIADEEFAEEFRKGWKELYVKAPPRRVKTKEIKIESHYPEYVKVAVDWWANAIISPKFDNGTELTPVMSVLLALSAKQYTAEEIKIFKDELAQSVAEEVDKEGRCIIHVDYHPCVILSEAAKKIGVSGVSAFPCKTYMMVTKESVWVEAGYKAPREELWKA